MTELLHEPFDRLLDRIASRTATPGGGSVAAGGGALSAALGRMVAAYSTPKNQAASPRMAEFALRFERVDLILRQLIDADAAAYEAMTAARKLAKADPSASAAFQDALWNAIGVPMQVMAASAEALAAMEAMTAFANKHLLSDLGVAAVLAAAAARAARFMVLVNLPELADLGRKDQLRHDADRIVEQCTTRSAAIEAFVHGQM